VLNGRVPAAPPSRKRAASRPASPEGEADSAAPAPSARPRLNKRVLAQGAVPLAEEEEEASGCGPHCRAQDGSWQTAAGRFASCTCAGFDPDGAVRDAVAKLVEQVRIDGKPLTDEQRGVVLRMVEMLLDKERPGRVLFVHGGMSRVRERCSWLHVRASLVSVRARTVICIW
jgi:hypothetical protein